ncbi:hypothetical protein TNCV_1870431 [Trichonephila clavipes]|nr:hypothetical protein TNCV_1870431 [Trichonephila clavipes]
MKKILRVPSNTGKEMRKILRVPPSIEKESGKILGVPSSKKKLRRTLGVRILHFLQREVGFLNGPKTITRVQLPKSTEEFKAPQMASFSNVNCDELCDYVSEEDETAIVEDM